jgi:AcrR family transcriptional regulator
MARRSPTVAITAEGTRRTQAERSAAMRARLLDATIASLAELGWARTTTTEVVRRAGVSRGAQVHHFPTKDDLVVAAIDHLFTRRQAEFREAFGELPDDERTADRAVDLLWQTVQGATFRAWLEVIVAARTDDRLHAALEPVEHRFHEDVERTFLELFPGAPTIAVRFAFTVLDGLAVEQIGCTRHDADEMLGVLKFLATTIGDMA